MLVKRALALLVVALALPYACAPIYRFPPARPFAGARLFNPYDQLRGTWQRANLHAHGRAWFGITNGRQTDAEVVRAYRALGYSVAGVSDYFHIAAHDGVPTLPLYEHGLNVGKHHQVAIGARQVVWFDLPFWQGASQKQYVINRVRSATALVALAHPSIMPLGYSASDLSQLTGYELFELVNGHFTTQNLWDAALSSGRPVWAIADDDTHDVTDPDRMAVAWSMIDAASPSSDDVIGALRDGRAFAVSKTSGEPDGTDATLVGVTVRHEVVTVTCSAPAELMFVGQGGRVLQTTSGATTASRAFTSGDTYIRTVIRTPHTVMYLNPVVRYQRHLEAPVATVDTAKTWTMRAAVVAGCAGLLLFAWRRPGGSDAARASDRSSLRRASSFLLVFVVAASAAVPAPDVERRPRELPQAAFLQN
jgi:hypothetical protein